MEKTEIEKLHDKIAELETWIKVLSKDWYGAQTLEELNEVMRQKKEYKKEQ